MAPQLEALRDTLLQAGASPEAASLAAEKLAGFDRQVELQRSDMRDGLHTAAMRTEVLRTEMREGFHAVDLRFDSLRAEMQEGFHRADLRFASIDERFTRVYWLGGVLSAMCAAILGRLLVIH